MGRAVHFLPRYKDFVTYPISNQDGRFESRLVAEVCKLWASTRPGRRRIIRNRMGWLNGSTVAMLASSGAQHSQDWECYLRPLCLAYNSSINPTTRYSPFFLMFGRQVRMPVDVMYGQPVESESPQTYASTLRARLELTFRCVRERMGHKLDRQKQFYDRKVHGEPYTQKEIWCDCARQRSTRKLVRSYTFLGPV